MEWPPPKIDSNKYWRVLWYKTEGDENTMIKNFKDIIQNYEDIVLEETQQLLAEIKEVKRNKYTIAKL